MKKILIVSFMLICAAAICYAANNDAPKATEPIGAIVETGGVFVGKLTSVIEKSLGGGRKINSLMMADDSGKTKIIPLDNTVKILDDSFHVITLNQLKPGEKISVKYSKENMADTVQVIK